MSRSLLCLVIFVGTCLTLLVSGERPLKVCSFNIQIFGAKKVNKPIIFAEIIKIIKEYDLIFIMEVRDTSDTAIQKLLAALNNKSTDKYKLLLSTRLGRTNSKEQYAYLYKESLLKVADSYEYDDGDESAGTDIFEREPLVVRFQTVDAAVKDFFIIGIHAAPDNVDTPKELEALIGVYEQASKKWNIDDAILMGDMNADCSYFTKASKSTNALRNDNRFVWLIDDDVDTTTKNTDCAYDRVILAGKNMIAHVKSAAPYNFQKEHKLDEKTTEEVSDHYPVIFNIA